MESVAAGASDKFRFTRTLILEDIPMVAEPICDLTELRYLTEYDWDGHRRGINMTEEEREGRMSECLTLFPDHCLRRFWYAMWNISAQKQWLTSFQFCCTSVSADTHHRTSPEPATRY
jgi:hypothetical protein